MATKLARKDGPAAWSTYGSSAAKPPGVGRSTSVERRRRVARLRKLVASGSYSVNLEHLAAAIIRSAGFMRAGDVRTLN